MNILYVENHPRFAAIVIKAFLAEHHVTVVPSLRQARQALTQDTFELVLLDYDLDDGKGTELAAELALQPKRPFILAVSSHALGNDALIASGADGVCSKGQFKCIGTVIAGLCGTGGAG